MDPLYHESAQKSQLLKPEEDEEEEGPVQRNFVDFQQRDRCVREKIQQAYERVDRVAMYLFPLIFFVFNCLYWSYYLILQNIFNLSLF